MLQVVALLCLGIAALAVLAPDGSWSSTPDVAAVVYAIEIVVLAVLWTVRARLASARGRAAVSLLALVLSTPIALLGSIGFTVLVLLLVVALVVLDTSVAAGLLAVGGMMLIGLVLFVLAPGPFWPSLADGLANSVPMGMLLGFGVALGAAWRGYEHRLAEKQQLVQRLRRAAVTEKELVLAEERARSARALHDGLGHRLTLVSMSLDFAERTREQDPQRAWGEVATARGTAQEALQEMRTWVRALHPVRDDEITGAAALNAIAESFRGTGLVVSLEVSEEADAALAHSEDASLLVVRTVQEGLTNALRHARAETVDITLRTDDRGMLLRVRNDLDSRSRSEIPPGAATPGFGLRSLIERAEAAGGTLDAAREGDSFHLNLTLARSTS